MKTNTTTLALIAFVMAAGVAGIGLAGYLIGGFLGFCISAILIGGLGVGGMQALMLFVLDASDSRQTVEAARIRASG